MDERRRRAWAALGIGPAWRLRDPGSPPGGREDPVDARGDMPAAEPEPEPEPAVAAVDPVALARPPGSPGSERDAAIATLAWPALQEAVAGCTACGLCGSRRHAVFGAGPSPARWMLVGEAPGEQEDARGEPFVGPAGQLLDEMLAAIGVDRPSEAFVANVLKCRPPGNRNPRPEEVARCEPYLLRQVELVRPALVLALGRFAAQSLLRTDASIASLRGRVHRLQAGAVEVPLVVTYHPAYLLRTPADKARSWQDLRLARRTCDGAA